MANLNGAGGENQGGEMTAAEMGGARAEPGVTIADRRKAGKALRDRVPRDALKRWKPRPDREDPLDILKAADATRRPDLVPLRYGRMLASPFTFYRGSAGVMAGDCAATLTTGLRVQACGDCHLLNFGGFATPERRIVLDINDLDETLPAPWEWDLQRLVASFALAVRDMGGSDSAARDVAEACARSFRTRLRAFSETDVLDIWYARVDDTDAERMLPEDRRAAFRKRVTAASGRASSELVFPKLVETAGGAARIRDTPPTIFHLGPLDGVEAVDVVRQAMLGYRETLVEDRRALFDRYELVDVAAKVVGIGSVGTLCLVGLFMSVAGRPLFLQMKEANASVLERFAGASRHAHHGERVVQGQRMVQPATDIFLGWATGRQGRHFYIRQLRDVKLRPLLETFDLKTLTTYAMLCGWALARSHAKSGDPWKISGYLGRSEAYDEAMGSFALAYADLVERDFERLKAGVRSGRIVPAFED